MSIINNFNVGNMAYPLNKNFSQQQTRMNSNGTISLQLPVYAVVCENNAVTEYYLFDDGEIIGVKSVPNCPNICFIDRFQRIWNLPLMNDEIHCIDIPSQSVYPYFLAGKTVKEVLCNFFKGRYGNLFNFNSIPPMHSAFIASNNFNPINNAFLGGIDFRSIEDEIIKEEKEREKFNEGKKVEIQYVLQAMLENPFQVSKNKNSLRISRKFMKEAFLKKKEIKIDTESDEDYIIVHL